MKIIYEPHPVTPERKAELREQGYKILDAAFAPPGQDAEPNAEGAQEQPKRGRKKASTEPNAEGA